MGPRRMDGFGRSAAGPPGGSRSQPVPRPSAIGQRPAIGVQRQAAPVARPAGSRPAGPRQAAVAAAYQAPTRAQLAATQPQRAGRVAPPKRRRGGWKVVLQFVVGLIVIAVVAVTIVALYLKFYT